MTDNGARAPDGDDPDAMVTTGAPAGEARATDATEPLVDPVEALTKEVGELQDRWKRALAEMENLRRRTEREVVDARTYGIAGFAREVIGVADNMHRALAAVPVESREAADPAVKALIEGVELTERELAKALEKHDVRRIEAKGQKFDPNFHQAMFEVPDASAPAGTVVQVMQEGYAIGGRVLRPALVGIAKGGPRAAPAAAIDDADTGAADA